MQLQSIYGDHFPLEARHHLAGWIEASFAGVEELEVGGGSNPAHEEHARVLVISLVQQLEQKAAETSDFLTKNKLEQIIENFKVSEKQKQFFCRPKVSWYHICLYRKLIYIIMISS